MTKNVLITGASRGIGRATALLAGRAGWNVAINYIGNTAAAESAVAEVIAAGGRAIAIQGDVSQEADVLRMFDEAEAAFGPLTSFVNNAGVLGPSMPLAEMDSSRLRRILEVNVLGALLAAREAARRMARLGPGSGAAIVNVSSLASRTGSPNEYVDYAAAKGAMDALTLGLSKELGRHGIRVNAVRPAFIETDIHASGGRPDRAQVLGAQTPLGRSGRPDEVAEAILWLLSDASSYVTGSFIDLAGGR
ncbi:SDR family oxidoreductase [Cystobacter ferrugineus]|uniref:NAD(P)-dependent oxidoreductase n=1 Tax=Cystobacter ferrugineus TaxID=83449 RepID=A0A1L9B3T4_9BACT|nr:SDR family oxidoreductase [Cystobacter ferrugineus]OJH36922.1 NAD(P)-dependent oxidoreductase [Cystobacter ferrugineus]